jgi:translation initiation factor IF-3
MRKVVANKFYKDREKPEGNLQGKYPINEQIEHGEILVIGLEGQNVGIITKTEAITIAEESGLDLVQVGMKGDMPVAKIMNFGKFVYTKKKQLGEAKKHQKVIQLKEVKLRPNIGDQDFLTKMNRAIQFFKDGKKVKFTVQFKGREVAMVDKIGPKVFVRVMECISGQDVGTLITEKEHRGHSYWSKIFFLKNAKSKN